jgi:hypothetical protein
LKARHKEGCIVASTHHSLNENLHIEDHQLVCPQCNNCFTWKTKETKVFQNPWL